MKETFSEADRPPQFNHGQYISIRVEILRTVDFDITLKTCLKFA